MALGLKFSVAQIVSYCVAFAFISWVFRANEILMVRYMESSFYISTEESSIAVRMELLFYKENENLEIELLFR